MRDFTFVGGSGGGNFLRHGPTGRRLGIFTHYLGKYALFAIYGKKEQVYFAGGGASECDLFDDPGLLPLALLSREGQWEPLLLYLKDRHPQVWEELVGP